jgi:small subunit ribosomal protein S17
MTDTANAETRNRRRVLQGIVTSTAMAKTITVLVERTYAHPKYGKFVRRNKKYHAHDEDSTAQAGDVVEIMATRPLSKLKRWRLVRIVSSPVVRTTDVRADASVEGGLQA